MFTEYLQSLIGPYRILALDFDGVVVDSLDVKTKAIGLLFAQEADHVETIVKFHEDNTGIDRRRKFAAIYRDILKRPLSDDELTDLAGSFGRLVTDDVVDCPMMPSAAALLSDASSLVPTYLVSATPEGELRQIVRRRALSQFFTEIYGSPKNKTDLLLEIADINDVAPKDILYVGDSLSDLHASQAAGTAFVGVATSNRINVFPPATPVIDDLSLIKPLLVPALQGQSIQVG